MAVEGVPFRSPLVAAAATVPAGAAAGGVSVWALLDFASKLATEVQVAIVLMIGLVVATAEFGVVLVALRYLRVTVELAELQAWSGSPTVRGSSAGPAALPVKGLDQPVSQG